MVTRFCLGAFAVLGAVSITSPSWAADDESDATEDDVAKGADETSEARHPSEENSDVADSDEKKPGATEDDAASADASPVEKEGETYLFVGARYRAIVVPKFMMNLFGDGGTTVLVHSFGPEFAIRKDGFEHNFALTYAPYSMDPTAFKSKSDGEDAWELVESNIKVLYATADFLWSKELSPELALNYGLGAGIGFVFGALERTQAYRDASGEYRPCVQPGNPNPGYCGFDNDHYGGYEEPSWASGGSKPIIFPWLGVQTGLRYKPHRNVVARLDVGFGLSGPFFGLGVDYGL